MKNFLDTVIFILSTMSTFVFIVILGAWFNGGSIEFGARSLGCVVVMALSFFINLIMYYFSTKYDDKSQKSLTIID